MEAAQVTHPGGGSASAPSQAERSWWSPADPAPLGLAGFALTTFILGMVNANAISGKDVKR